ncbi:MAG TPA: Cthe_2314 family HEPN domain-containing protein [Ohtaekwangia sp.]|nr:Cthe_2314 family HEPN domain-containing protein [Ohtaekwangia sp.]
MERDLQLNAIDLFQKEIVTIYKEKKLRSISGLDMDFVIGDRQVLAWFFTAVRKGQNKFKKVNFHEVFDDIVFCSDEILYHTALLYLYGPYLNNPVNDGHFFHDRMIYPNHQNLPAKRFAMHSNTAFEKVYNFWDRIGDLIAIYLPEAFPPGRNVYFGTSIDAIPEKYHSSESYKWLKAFKEDEYKTMNSKRIGVVHYLTNDTVFRHKHLEASSNKEVLEGLIAERDALPDFFTKQIDFALEGFVRTVQLLEEITAEELKDIE